MSNMSYCRFRNTLTDLRDCILNIEDHELSEEEAQARYRMVKEMAATVERYDLDHEGVEYFNPNSEEYQYGSEEEDYEDEDYEDE